MAQCIVAKADAELVDGVVEFCEEDEWTLCEEDESETGDFDYADVAEDDVFVF